MNCINRNLPEYKLINEANNGNHFVTNYLINKYQEEKGVDTIPTLEELGHESGHLVQIEKSIEDINTELTSKLKDYLKSIGVKYRAVEALRDQSGEIISGVALSNMLTKIVQVIEGKADISTLPEEAAHFFVSSLDKDSHLYKSMYSKIDRYKVYQDVLEEYKNDPKYQTEDKLREEAMGKLIALHLISKNKENETTQNLEYAEKWWNLLWNWIKGKFNSLSTVKINQIQKEVDPFGKAAEMLLDKDLSKSSELREGEFLQKSNIKDKQEEYTNKIKEMAKKVSYSPDEENPFTKKKGVYKVLDSINNTVKSVKHRVTDRVKKLQDKRGWAPRTPEEQKLDDIRREWGVKGHNAFNNIIQRAVEKLQSKNITEENTYDLTQGQYNKLSNYVEDLISSYPAGTTFLTETFIYDPKFDEAGTIDFIAITPEGNIDILDWKFTNLKNKTSISWWKEEEYNVQLNRYKKILEDYGIDKEDFRKIRVIPISTVVDKGVLTSLNIGDVDITKTPEVLHPVPMTGLQGGTVELTGDPHIDDLINSLSTSLEKVTKRAPVTQEERERKYARIEHIKNAIKELQLTGDIKHFISNAKFEFNTLKNTYIDSFENEELVNAQELLEFYKRTPEFINDKLSEKYRSELSEIIFDAGKLSKKIEQEILNRAINMANQENVSGLLEPQKETGWAARQFASLSQFNHPIFKTFYRLVQKQKGIIYKESLDINNKINKVLEDLQKSMSLKGIHGTDIFNGILKFKDGVWTGDLLDKYSEDFRAKKAEAITTENTKWLRDNHTFDRTKYSERFKENVELWSKIYRHDEDSKKKILKKISDFEKKYNIDKFDSALFNKSNYFLTPIKNHQSEDWKTLQDNKELKAFYDLFNETINQMAKYLDMDLKYGFVPNIQKDLMNQIMQNGITNISGMKDVLKEYYSVKSHSSVGMINSLTGEIEHKIPVFFTGNITPGTKTKELGKSLSLFANMAINFKYMSEIESSSQILKDVLENNSKTLITGVKGDPNSVIEVANSKTTLNDFNDFFNYYLYGIKGTKLKGSFKFMGNEVSTDRAFNDVLRFFSAKALCLNLTSITANAFGGYSNALFEGAKGRFYNNKEFLNATRLLGMKDRMAWNHVHFWDIESTHTSWQKANKLSVEKSTKNLTFEQFYIGQRAGDFLPENGCLVAMLQSHTIDQGKIRKRKGDEKSLLEQGEIKDGKLVIPGLTDEEFTKFRNKVKYLYSEFKGNMSPDDISRVKLTTLGQLGMMFRNWIPRMAYERLGNLREVGDLGVWEEGKYKTFAKQIMQLSVSNLISAVGAYGVLGIGSGIFDGNLEKNGEIAYLKALEKDPSLKITKEEYIEMYKGNIRSAALELQMIIAVFLMYAMVKPAPDDDDEKKDAYRKLMVKIANRNIQELSFWANPSSAQSLLKMPIPIAGLGIDIENWLHQLMGESYGHLIGDEKAIKKYHPMRETTKLFPISTQIERVWEMMYPPKVSGE